MSLAKRADGHYCHIIIGAALIVRSQIVAESERRVEGFIFFRLRVALLPDGQRTLVCRVD